MEKIAVIRRNGLGDLLCAFPLILYLHKNKPKAEITLFVEKTNASLLPYLPPLVNVVVLPPKGNKYFNLLRVALKYRKVGFDIAISAKTSPMKLMNLFLFVLGAKKRIAVIDSSWSSKLVNQGKIYDKISSKKQHQALKGLQLVAPQLEKVPDDLYPVLSLSDSVRKKYAHLLELPPPYLLMSASTSRFENRFDESRYAKLVNRLYADLPFSVILVGQEPDRKRAEKIAGFLNTPKQVIFPKNFEEFMFVLDACPLYFVCDGGVAHIGAGLKKHEVVLFGENSPTEWHPLNKKCLCLYHPLHVNQLNDDEIFEGLHTKMSEVVNGRIHL